MKEQQSNATMPPTATDTARRTGLRLNPQMAMMIMLTLLALALPITILSIGLVQMSRSPAVPIDNQQPSPENPGLRAILEKVADEKLTPKTLVDGRGQYVIFENPSRRPQLRKQIAATARSLGGSVLSSSSQDEGMTVQIPSDAANRFQTLELSGAKIISEPSLKTENLIYLIRFEQ